MKQDLFNLFFVFLATMSVILTVLNYYSPKAHSDWKDFIISIALLLLSFYFYNSDKKSISNKD